MFFHVAVAICFLVAAVMGLIGMRHCGGNYRDASPRFGRIMFFGAGVSLVLMLICGILAMRSDSQGQIKTTSAIRNDSPPRAPTPGRIYFYKLKGIGSMRRSAKGLTRPLD
jgi:hypothetical protein